MARTGAGERLRRVGGAGAVTQRAVGAVEVLVARAFGDVPQASHADAVGRAVVEAHRRVAIGAAPALRSAAARATRDGHLAGASLRAFEGTARAGGQVAGYSLIPGIAYAFGDEAQGGAGAMAGAQVAVGVAGWIAGNRFAERDLAGGVVCPSVGTVGSADGTTGEQHGKTGGHVAVAAIGRRKRVRRRDNTWWNRYRRIDG